MKILASCHFCHCLNFQRGCGSFTTIWEWSALPPEPEKPGEGVLFGPPLPPVPELPKTRGKKATAKAYLNEEAMLRAECAKLFAEKNVPCEEIARFFPGEILTPCLGRRSRP